MQQFICSNFDSVSLLFGTKRCGNWQVSGYYSNRYNMEEGFVPIRKSKFVQWLLQTAIDNDWTILFEYSNEGMTDFLRQNAIEVTRPPSSTNNYEFDCRLTAIKHPVVTNSFVKKIIGETHVMSAHDEKSMIYLFADDYHKDCFTCSSEFYNRYKQLLCDQRLIYSR